MNLIILASLAVLTLPLIGMTQETAASTVCPVSERMPEGVVLSVCNHEHGMVGWPQPRLYLRIYEDGRGEIETGAPPPPGDAYQRQILILKTFNVDADEIAEIRSLGRMADFQNAKDIYPAYVIGTDSSVATTVAFSDSGKVKKIIVNNFSYVNINNKKNYGMSLCLMMARVAVLRDRGLGIIREPPTISFCELMKNRESYIGNVIAMNAVLEYSELQQFIYDPECAEPGMGSQYTTEKVGVGFNVKRGDAEAIQALKNRAFSLRDPRFGGRARVYIYGVLRDNRDRAAVTRDFRFDISEFKTIDAIVLPYKGRLEPGWMYADSFDAGDERKLKLSSPLKMPLHHAARIEWLNAGKFPRLRAAGHTFITFRVVSRDIRKIGVNRWNDIYTCEILDLQ